MLNPAHRENDQQIEAAEEESAALGLVVGKLTGDIAAERTSIIWPTLGRAFLYPKGACHEEDACELSSCHCPHH
jgi:hypothetical protein